MNISGLHGPILLTTAMMLIQATSLAAKEEISHVKQWQVFEVTMKAAEQEGNPYVTYLPEEKPGRVIVLGRSR